jgi:hypothetical protein
MASIAAHDWYLSRHSMLFEEPPREILAAPLPARTSTLAVSIDLPFATLSGAANGAFPPSVEKKGTAPLCKMIGPYDPPWYDLRQEVCLDARYQFSVKRGGPITVVRSASVPNGVRITLPLSFKGSAGFRGDLAKILDLDKKNFKGAFVATIDATLDIGSDWCPKVATKTSIDWKNQAEIEIVGDVWVPVGALAGPDVNSALKKADKEIAKAVHCDIVKDGVVQMWKARAVPITLPDGSSAFANINPVSAGFSGLVVGKDRITLGVAVLASTEVSTNPAAGGAKPLPPLKRIAPAPGRIEMLVPVRAAYDRIVELALAELKGRRFAVTTAAGEAVAVTVDDLRLYPSGKRVVLGLGVTADLPGRWFDTRGWVYLFAEPETLSGGRALHLKNVGFTQVLDNEFWNFASAVLEGPITEALAEQSTIDLSGHLADVEQVLRKALAEAGQKGGWSLTLNKVGMGITQVVPAAAALEAEVAFTAAANATLTRLTN